jgi:hypothetical protein
MYQYSFANVDLHISLKGGANHPSQGGLGPPLESILKVSGYTTGEGLINIAPRAPTAVPQYGAYGDMVVSMQRITSADLSFQLLQTSPDNKWLQRWVNHFQSLAFGGTTVVVPLMATLTDNMGSDVVQLVNGVILAKPMLSRGQTVSTVTWVLTFETADIQRDVGAGDAVI